mmetsp:Transcript_34972/g.69053  ORF Transcript_34972/g.69053 Transcript_34972/m.69053 type:complete len:212 (+) Transcript_34972:972-1607(+)
MISFSSIPWSTTILEAPAQTWERMRSFSAVCPSRPGRKRMWNSPSQSNLEVTICPACGHTMVCDCTTDRSVSKQERTYHCSFGSATHGRMSLLTSKVWCSHSTALIQAAMADRGSTLQHGASQPGPSRPARRYRLQNNHVDGRSSTRQASVRVAEEILSTRFTPTRFHCTTRRQLRSRLSLAQEMPAGPMAILSLTSGHHCSVEEVVLTQK